MNEIDVGFGQKTFIREAAAGYECNVRMKVADEIHGVSPHVGNRGGGKFAARAEISNAALAECNGGGRAVCNYGEIAEAGEVGNEVRYSG